MSRTKRKKSAISMVTGRKPIDALYRGVIRYVEANGGSLLVVGGVQVLEWPGDPKAKFSIVVKCMGEKPRFAK